MKDCNSQTTEMEGAIIIRNVGIKLCQFKCAERGQCLSIQIPFFTDSGRNPRQTACPVRPLLATSTGFGEFLALPGTHEEPPPRGGCWHKVDKDDSPLHDACRKGNLRQVRRILCQGLVNIDSREGSHGKTPLMVAAQEGHCRIFSFLIGKGANKSHVDNDVDDVGNNVMHWGCKYGRLDLIESVISQGSVDINSRGMHGKTPLMNAVFYGKRKVVDLLVSQGGLTHLVDDKGENILHLASLSGRMEMVKHILSQNMTDINARDKEGKTAAMITKAPRMKQCKTSTTERDGSVIMRNIGIKLCQLKCAERGQCLSIQYNIDTLTCRVSGTESRKTKMKDGFVSFARSLSDVTSSAVQPSDIQDLYDQLPKPCIIMGDLIGHNPLRGSSKSTVHHLKDGDDVLTETADTANELDEALAKHSSSSNYEFQKQKEKKKLNFNSDEDVMNIPEISPQLKIITKDPISNSPLHNACRRGNLTRLKRILSGGLVHINSRDGNQGKTPLMVAAQEGHCRIFDFLIEKGANISQVDNGGKNFLHWACKGGHVGMVECVLPLYDVHTDNNKVSPLMQAAFRGYRDVFEFLVCMGANVSQRNVDHDTVLHWACRGGHLDMVKYLLSQCSVDINSRGKDGQNPLMAAVLCRHTDVSQLLMSMGANLSHVDDFGSNVLHWGCRYGALDVMKTVLSQDTVDINSSEHDGKTPLMKAAYYGKRNVFDLLVSKGCLTHLVDVEGNTILHLASLGGRVEMVRHILSKNISDVNARNKKGNTAAMIAKHTRNARMYVLLASRGCPVA
ncbi:serine/threonine-protein phosphatase 6 regulatory ankyrin repeat subunit A-like [Haliotis asinina]|uniref:serine/threonine-protein phosphatase 6 regulatory ankyrin repeat subunit A-like n=1 Tax=Haliotis asinina TaxID=109174 RepID=UPI003531A42E